MRDEEELAIDGGKPVNDREFPEWPQFAEQNLVDVLEPLKTGRVNYWTGSKGTEFEAAWAAWSGAKHAISVTNGTAALHTALSALDIGPGDEVIVPSYSFIATALSVLEAGAIPVFCDVTTDHTIDPAKLEGLITERTRGIIPVHLYGVVCDMGPILEIAKARRLYVIEDCAQAIGGAYRGTKVGAIGDVGCFSFCQAKHFTTGGEGGMVISDNEDVAWECRSFRDHGYDVSSRETMAAVEAKRPYMCARLGFNYRMTEIQSIIGINELARFDDWNLPRRKAHAARYDAAFAEVDWIRATPYNTPERQNAYWWYPVRLDLERLSCRAPEFVKALEAEGVPCWGIQWPEGYRERVFVERKGQGRVNFPFESKEYTDPDAVRYEGDHCPTAISLRDETFTIFLHPNWEPEHIDLVIKAVCKVGSAMRA